MNLKTIEIGYTVFAFGIIISFVEICLVIWVSVVTGEYKPIDSHIGLYTVLVGFLFLKIETIIENQRKILDLSDAKLETDQDK